MVSQTDLGLKEEQSLVGLFWLLKYCDKIVPDLAVLKRTKFTVPSISILGSGQGQSRFMFGPFIKMSDTWLN